MRTKLAIGFDWGFTRADSACMLLVLPVLNTRVWGMFRHDKGLGFGGLQRTIANWMR